MNFYERRNYTVYSPVQLNFCAENFPNNGDDFGFASDEVPQGDQETKGYSFLV